MTERFKSSPLRLHFELAGCQLISEQANFAAKELTIVCTRLNRSRLFKTEQTFWCKPVSNKDYNAQNQHKILKSIYREFRDQY